MIQKIYRTPVIVTADGMVLNPEPDEIIVDGKVYIPAGSAR